MAALLALLTADLMQTSQVAGAAQRVGGRLRVFATVDALTSALAAANSADETARLVIVDLTLPGLDVAALMAGLRALPLGQPRTLAFGPHVHADRLAAALAAGCERVVSRGQFHAQMDALLAEASR
jgi:CheY-like chemotaxis protein